MLNKYESESIIPELREKICSYAHGNVLETGVGTSRNLQYYP